MALNFFYVSIISILIGITIGLISGVITKKLVNFKGYPGREIIMLFMLAYLSYVTAELA